MEQALLRLGSGDPLCGMGEASFVLAHRRFRRFLAGQGLSLLGDGLVPLTLTFAALQVSGPGGAGAWSAWRSGTGRAG